MFGPLACAPWGCSALWGASGLLPSCRRLGSSLKYINFHITDEYRRAASASAPRQYLSCGQLLTDPQNHIHLLPPLISSLSLLLFLDLSSRHNIILSARCEMAALIRYWYPPKDAFTIRLDFLSPWAVCARQRRPGRNLYFVLLGERNQEAAWGEGFWCCVSCELNTLEANESVYCAASVDLTHKINKIGTRTLQNPKCVCSGECWQPIWTWRRKEAEHAARLTCV